MPTFPTPGDDLDTWGDELNELVRVDHDESGFNKAHATRHKAGGLDQIRLDELAAAAANLSLGNNKITSLATPQALTDAATKGYVDAVAQGLDVKMSVQAATTANITLSGAQTIDGVAVVAGNRVLVKNQTTAANNGLYTVVDPAAWTRTTDADIDAEVTAGMFTFVEAGTTLADTGWVLVTNNPITVGSTALSFSQFSSSGGGSPTGAVGGVLSGTLPNPGFSANMATQAELDAHANQVTAAHAATSISFTPQGSIGSTNVQQAIQEVRDEAGAAGGAIINTIVDAKGDLIAATAADTVGRLPVGTTGQVLTADAATSTGLLWASVTAGATTDAVSSVKTSNYTIVDADSIVQASSASGSVTVTLPSAVGRTGRRFTVVRVAASASPYDQVIIDATAAQTIGGATTVALANRGDAVEAVSDGANWQVASSSVRTRQPYMHWYVNPAIAVSGAGRTLDTGMKTFAEAHAAANEGDAIYIANGLVEQITISKTLHIVGLGNLPYMQAPSSLTSVNDILFNVTGNYVTIENMNILGHANWKGTLVCQNAGIQLRLINVNVDGTGGTVDPTAYSTAPTPGTGIGGIGVLCHFNEGQYFESFGASHCSIGFALGTESSTGMMVRGRFAANAQDHVCGMNTSPVPAPAPMTQALGTAPFGYGTATPLVGGWVIIGVKCTSAVVIANNPTWHVTASGAGMEYIKFDTNEAYNLAPIFQVDGSSNRFHSVTTSLQTTAIINGNDNLFDGIYMQGAHWENNGSGNVFTDVSGNAAAISGAGSFATYQKAQFFNGTGLPFSHAGSTANLYDRCSWQHDTGSAPSMADLGASPKILKYGGVSQLVHGAAVETNINRGTIFVLRITNTTAPTLSNPIDTSCDDSSHVFCTERVTWDIIVNSGVTHGTISVGNKFVLVGGGTTLWAGGTIAATKRRQFTCYYNATDDKWIELSRSSADIG